MPDVAEPILSVRNLKKYFPIRRGVLARVAAHRVQGGQLLLPFDPLPDRHEAEGVGEPDDGSQDRAVREAVPDTGHEGRVHLQDVDREVPEVPE